MSISYHFDEETGRPLFVAEAVVDAGGYPAPSGPLPSQNHLTQMLATLSRCEERLIALERKTSGRAPRGAA